MGEHYGCSLETLLMMMMMIIDHLQPVTAKPGKSSLPMNEKIRTTQFTLTIYTVKGTEGRHHAFDMQDMSLSNCPAEFLTIEEFVSDDESFGEEEDTDDDDDHNLSEEITDMFEGQSWDQNGDFWPFPSEGFLLLICLMNSRSHTISEGTMKMILHIIQRFGGDVPSLRSLKNFKFPGLGQLVKQNMHGNKHFSMLDIMAISKMAVAHPKSGLSSSDDQTVEVKLKVFIDDMSTNKSRRWSPMGVCQIQPSGVQSDSEFITVVSVSTDVEMLQIVDHIITDIEKDERQLGYVAARGEIMDVKVTFEHFVADMAEMSAICSHKGAASNYPCPKCKVKKGETQKGEMRTKDETQLKLLNSDGSEGVKVGENPLFNHQFDPHKKVPYGSLHLLKLGLIKQLCQKMKEGDNILMDCYIAELAPTLGRKFLKYIGSRQGKDFLAFIQIAPLIALFTGLPTAILKACATLAELSKMVMCKKIGSSPSDIGKKGHEYMQRVISLGDKQMLSPKLHALEYL
ncbi:unnamed protein product, partial [Owenia fusiformis]